MTKFGIARNISLSLLIGIVSMGVFSSAQDVPPPKPKPQAPASSAKSNRSKSPPVSVSLTWPQALQGGWRSEKTSSTKTETPACADNLRERYRLFVPDETRDPISFVHEHSEELVNGQGYCQNNFTPNGKKVLVYTISSDAVIKTRGAHEQILVVRSGQCKGDCNTGSADTMGSTFTITNVDPNRILLDDGTVKLTLLREGGTTTPVVQDDTLLKAFMGRWKSSDPPKIETWANNACEGSRSQDRGLVIERISGTQAFGRYTNVGQGQVTRDNLSGGSGRCNWGENSQPSYRRAVNARVVVECADSANCTLVKFFTGCDGDCAQENLEQQLNCTVTNPVVLGGSNLSIDCPDKNGRSTAFFDRVEP